VGGEVKLLNRFVIPGQRWQKVTAWWADERAGGWAEWEGAVLPPLFPRFL